MCDGVVGFAFACAIVFVGFGVLFVLLAWADLIIARARLEKGKRQ
jgi:hypothetical protein